ncbi:MAG: cyclase family protein [Deltaproteobacteria bacterium]|nr:cyclase family protein [Deltaproteobacteria bacterium]
MEGLTVGGAARGEPPPPVASRRGVALWVSRAARVGPQLLLLLAVAGMPAHGVAAGPAIDESRVVDLTYTFDDTTIYWPTEDGFHLQQGPHGFTPQGYFYAANHFTTAEHGGTHMDAPIHFAQGRSTADQVPLPATMGPAVVVDVRDAAAADRDYRLTVADLERWEAKYGRIPDGAIVLMRSDWGRFWPNRRDYLGTAEKGDVANLHFPGFSKEAAEWLLARRSIDAIGVDTPSIDHGPSKTFIVHQTINGANKPAFENVANMDKLPEQGALFVALPMKIGGGSGAPARIMAVLP